MSGDAETLERLLREHEALFRDEQPPAYVPRGPRPDYSGLDSRVIIAREHQLDGWESCATFFAARDSADSPVARFEEAVDAVIAGDLPKLQTLLAATPDLARARSARQHHATLLNYIGANGIEGFRQKTPPNVVAVAATLLDAGAEVDALADLYGGHFHTLALIATSIHPKLAGVQEDLTRFLIARGAGADSSINASLADGQDKVASFLAMRGAPVDLEGAAGLGQLDTVRTFFDANGRLASSATSAQMLNGFSWACRYGHADVATFLLDRGADVNALLAPYQQTGLHWAAFGGYGSVVDLLLKRGARVDVVDGKWETTPLVWALHRWSENEVPREPRYYEVVRLLVDHGAHVKPDWLTAPKVRADAAMRHALRHGSRNTRS